MFGRLFQADSLRKFLLSLTRPSTWALVVATGTLLFVLGAGGLVLAATVPALFGNVHYTVTGGSMEPALPVGSVAVTKTVPAESLKVGDIIVFPLPDRADQFMIHRIVGIDLQDGEQIFTTKGDGNPTPDPRPLKLEGKGSKVWYVVPFAGYIIDFIHWPLVRLLLVLMPSGLFVGMALERIWRPKRDGRQAATEERLG